MHKEHLQNRQSAEWIKRKEGERDLIDLIGPSKQYKHSLARIGPGELHGRDLEMLSQFYRSNLPSMRGSAQNPRIDFPTLTFPGLELSDFRPLTSHFLTPTTQFQPTTWSAYR
jgi:hypothetical protein